MWYLYISDAQDNFTLLGVYDVFDDLMKAFDFLHSILVQFKNPDLIISTSYEGD